MGVERKGDSNWSGAQHPVAFRLWTEIFFIIFGRIYVMFEILADSLISIIRIHSVLGPEQKLSKF